MSDCLKNTRIKKENILLILLTILVFLINIMHIRDLSIFTITTDEFGYWSNAAFLAGVDWSNIISNIPYYYSYGYSLLLVPLFWLFEDPSSMYKAAIILNGVFLSASFLLCYDIARKLSALENKYFLLAISFLISMYPTYIAYSNIAWSECLLIFVFWLLSWCFVNLNILSNIFNYIFITFLSVYIYAIHQRALGVLIASIILILLMSLHKQISLKQLIITMLAFMFFWAMASNVKEYLQMYLWLDNSGNLANDYTAQTGKLAQLFTIDGFVKALKILCGQIFYLGASTYLVCYFGIYKLIKSIGKVIANNYYKAVTIESNPDFYLHLFLLTSLLMTIAISVTFNINPNRVDQIVYGRYTEIVIGRILLVGILELFEKEDINNRLFLGILGLFIFLTVITYYIIQEFNFSLCNLLHSVGLFFMQTPLSIFIPCLIAILAGRLIYITFPKKNIQTFISIVLIAGVFLSSGEVVAKSIVGANHLNMEIVKSVNIITSANDELPIYFLMDDPNMTKVLNHPLYSKILYCYQFLLVDREIFLVNSAELKTHDEDKFVLSSEIYNLFDLLKDYQFCISSNDSYLLINKTNPVAYNYRNFNSNNDITLSLSMFGTQNAVYTENKISAEGLQGSSIQSPMKKLTQGVYEFTIDIDLKGIVSEEVGILEVISIDGDVLYSQTISADAIDANKNLSLKANFNVEQDNDYVTLKLSSNRGSNFAINNVCIQKVM